MKIASIDIGTNAIKSKIFKTTPASIEFIKGIRSPIRLGSDVFKNGNLSQGKLNQVIETIREYEEVFKENSISHYEIVATSAFRDTANSEDARRYIETAINHPLRVISGLEEAKLIRFHPKSNTGKNKIFVDLGGGSTEFFIRNEQETIIRSFQLGAVRNMLQKDNREEWQRLEEWLESIKPKKKLIGIGGNIRSFLNAHESKEMSLNEFKNKVKKLSKLSTKEKINFDFCIFKTVGAMNRIRFQTFCVFPPYGTRFCLCRISSTHQFSIPQYRVITFKHLNDHRARRHKLNQVIVKRSFFMHGVELLCLLFC